MLDGDTVLVRHTGAVLPEPQLHTSAFGEASSVDLRLIDGLVHCAVMEAVDEIERHRELAVEVWRENGEAVRGIVLLRHRE